MRVMGYIDGVLYTIEADPTLTPDLHRGIIVTASPIEVLALLAVNRGESIAITPVGPHIEGSLDNVEAIYAMLLNLTQVVAATDAPELVEPDIEPLIH